MGEVEVKLEIIATIILILVSLGLILAVLLQKGKSAGLSGSIAGGAEHLFGKQKSRGIDAFLEKLTTGLAIAFILFTLFVAYLGAN